MKHVRTRAIARRRGAEGGRVRGWLVVGQRMLGKRETGHAGRAVRDAHVFHRRPASELSGEMAGHSGLAWRTARTTRGRGISQQRRGESHHVRHGRALCCPLCCPLGSARAGRRAHNKINDVSFPSSVGSEPVNFVLNHHLGGRAEGACRGRGAIAMRARRHRSDQTGKSGRAARIRRGRPKHSTRARGCALASRDLRAHRRVERRVRPPMTVGMVPTSEFSAMFLEGRTAGWSARTAAKRGTRVSATRPVLAAGRDPTLKRAHRDVRAVSAEMPEGMVPVRPLFWRFLQLARATRRGAQGCGGRECGRARS